jgi:hypothetical protein
MRFQMTLGPLDGGLRGLVFGGSGGSRTCRFGSSDGLSGIAHFLHGRTGHAPKQAGNTD